MNNLIPRFIIENFNENNFSGEFKAITMFLDISGFTQMTESLMKNGKEGAEILTEIINKIFTPTISIIYENNGYISTFAGDANTSIFPITSCDPNKTVHASEQIRSTFEKTSLHKTRFGDYKLSVKTGLSYGKVEWRIISSDKVNHYFFKGSAIKNSANCEKRCLGNEIIIDQNLEELIDFKVTKLNDDFFMLNENKVEDFSQTNRKSYNADISVLEHFVPSSILEMKSLGEFRNVISCFISFEEKKNFHLNVQKILELTPQYGGYFNKIDFGDKGYVILVLFGAPIAQEKMYIRSCDFALAVQSLPDFNSRIGLSTGIAFTGFVGSEERGEYTALGMSVNKAARLMMTAKWKEICIDQSFAKSIEKDYQITFVEEKMLKGINNSVSIYKITKRREQKELFFEGKFFNRIEEMNQLEHILNENYKNFKGINYIDGAAAVGKSRLFFELMKRDRENSVNWIFLPCDDILKKSFNPIKYFLYKYFNQSDENNKDINLSNFNSKYDEILPFIKKDDLLSEYKRTKSFLAAFINLFWTDSLYESLDAKNRYENMLYSVKNLIKALCNIQPVAIIIEDANSIDSDSVNVLKYLLNDAENTNLSIFAICRLNDDYSNFNFDLKNIKEIRLTVQAFNEKNTKLFVQNKFIGDDPTQKIHRKTYDMIWEKSEGNPFFIEQIILYIKDNKLINEKFELIKSDFEIPADINSLIVSRIKKSNKNCFGSR
ncbi:MAG: hypothetical protein K8S23_03310 [Candidatus Cloacimonetes bacterium]|nr:hypothetical protein [Candidatus Cloacimonadota bacterium]